MSTLRKAQAARAAARTLLGASDDQRRAGLEAMASRLEQATEVIGAANTKDLGAAAADGLDASLVDRLHLGPEKLATVIAGCRQIGTMPDPIGRTMRSTVLDDGLHLYQVSCPLGVIACIFESRPDVVVQIASLALRTGNAVILKGGREAAATNEALTTIVRDALAEVGLPVDAVQLVETREEVAQLLDLDAYIDLVIPRGSGSLVRHIIDNTRIPVLGHAEGLCHVYVDAAADRQKALRIIVDAKLDYPAACNAVETILVHRDHAGWIRELVSTLVGRGVDVRQGGAADFGMEYNAPTVNIGIVEDLEGALRHIAEYGSGHTEAIVTEDPAAARGFVAAVDAAGVFVNASTRFADGYRYGLGAEVGISTNRIHARGPVGLDGLVSYRWILVGDGHVAGDFGTGAGQRSFRHAPSAARFHEQWEAWRER